MTDVDRIRDQLSRSLEGDAWHGPALLEILEGLDVATATFRPIPEGHTIAELVLHVTTWIRVARERVEGGWPEVTDAEDFPQQPTDEPGWRSAVGGLVEAVAALDRTLSETPEDLLATQVRHGGYTFGLMLDGVVQHNLYHAGQMAILRKAPSARVRGS